MNIYEFEKCFQSEATLGNALDMCSEDIARIEYYSDLFKKGVIADNPNEISAALTELAGIYMSLAPKAALAETEKANRELKHYHTRKMEVENAGEKFVATAMEKEASGHVASYRRVRNLIQAYLESVEKSIQVAQSLLKSVNKEMNIPQGGD